MARRFIAANTGWVQSTDDVSPAFVTISAWLRADVLPGADTGIIGCGQPSSPFNNDKVLYITSAGTIVFYAWDGSQHHLASTSVPPLGKWFHVAATADGVNLRIYINGVESNSVACGSTDPTAGKKLQIGRCNIAGASHTYFTGAISRVVVWNGALSGGQIRRLYAVGGVPSGGWPAIIGYWPLTFEGYERDIWGADTGGTLLGGRSWSEPDPPIGMDYLSIRVSAVEAPPSIALKVDEATIRVRLTPSSADIAALSETATVPLKITPITTAEGQQTTDAGAIYLDMQVLGGECYSTFAAQLLGEGEADLRWISTSDQERWVDEEELRWDEGDVSLGEGIHC